MEILRFLHDSLLLFPPVCLFLLNTIFPAAEQEVLNLMGFYLKSNQRNPSCKSIRQILATFSFPFAGFF